MTGHLSFAGKQLKNTRELSPYVSSAVVENS